MQRQAATVRRLEGQVDQVQCLSQEILESLASRQDASQVAQLAGNLECTARAADDLFSWAYGPAQLPTTRGTGICSDEPATKEAVYQGLQRSKPSGSVSSVQAVCQTVTEVGGNVRIEGIKHGSAIQVALDDPDAMESLLDQGAELALIVPDILCATLVLGDDSSKPNVKAVAIFSTSESIQRRSAWCSSEHLVFRKLSGLAVRALEHFTASCTAEGRPALEALLKILLWLCSCRNLFERPCEITGTLLAADAVSQGLLPPLLRPFRSCDVQSLLEAASPLHSCPAYHLTAAPAGLL